MKKVYTVLAAPVVGAFLVLAAFAQPGQAQTAFGAQLGWGTSTDFGVGARALLNIPNVDLEGAASVDIYNPSGGSFGDFWEVNANIFYHFHVADAPSLIPYLGAGLNVGTASNGATTTRAGLNLGGGVRIPGETISPFAELRGVVSDFDQVVITVGLLFGPTRFVR